MRAGAQKMKKVGTVVPGYPGTSVPAVPTEVLEQLTTYLGS